MKVEFFENSDIEYLDSVISSWLSEMDIDHPGYKIFKVNQSVLPAVKKSDGSRLAVGIWYELKPQTDCPAGIKEQQ